MKVLKKIGIGLGAIIAILLIIPLFTKNEYAVMRETVIARPKAAVFDYIVLLKNQDNFSVWAQMDNVGAGEQEIKKILPGERIDYELRFLKPMKAINQAYLKIESMPGEQTKVMWGFNAKTPYPFNIMLLFFDVEKMIGKDFETGLANLKKILEKK